MSENDGYSYGLGEYATEGDQQVQSGDSLDERGVDDILDEGYSPPEKWSVLEKFGNTAEEERELATWLSHADGVRLFQAALRADVEFAIVYGASANTRRWWPTDLAIGFAPQDDAEAFAPLPPSDYKRQGGPNTMRDHGGWVA